MKWRNGVFRFDQIAFGVAFQSSTGKQTWRAQVQNVHDGLFGATVLR
jgi:hypothetical protein